MVVTGITNDNPIPLKQGIETLEFSYFKTCLDDWVKYGWFEITTDDKGRTVHNITNKGREYYEKHKKPEVNRDTYYED